MQQTDNKLVSQNSLGQNCCGRRRRRRQQEGSKKEKRERERETRRKPAARTRLVAFGGFCFCSCASFKPFFPAIYFFFEGGGRQHDLHYKTKFKEQLYTASKLPSRALFPPLPTNRLRRRFLLPEWSKPFFRAAFFA